MKKQEIVFEDGNGLPIGWVKVPLGEIIQLKNGYAFKSSDYSDSGMPLIRISEIQNGIVDISNAVKIPFNLVESDFYVEKGDILIAMSGATTGKFGIYLGNEKALQNQRVGNFKPISDKLLNGSFLYYTVEGIKGKIEKLAYGGAQPNISSKMIEGIAISFPPLPEQNRIAEKLERLFARLARAEAALAAAETALERYRQSVLNTAFKAEDEEGNMKEGWRLVKLGEVCQINPRFSKPILNEQTMVSFIPMKCVEEESGNVNLSEKRPFFEVKKGFTPFENGDVIFAKITPCMENGKAAVLNNLENGIGFGSTEFYVFRCTEHLDNQFLFHFLIRKIFREEAKQHFSGAVGQQRVPKGFLENKIIPLPSLSIQKDVVNAVEAAFEKSVMLNDYLLTAQRDCTLIRQSILQASFSGRLVSQDERDESAVVLLRRIKEAKYNIEKKSGRKQKA